MTAHIEHRPPLESDEDEADVFSRDPDPHARYYAWASNPVKYVGGWTKHPVQYRRNRYMRYLTRADHPLFFDGDPELNPKHPNAAKDLVGQWFGDLECISKHETRSNGTLWKFRCHSAGCGREWVSRAYGVVGRSRCPNC